MDFNTSVFNKTKSITAMSGVLSDPEVLHLLEPASSGATYSLPTGSNDTSVSVLNTTQYPITIGSFTADADSLTVFVRHGGSWRKVNMSGGEAGDPLPELDVAGVIGKPVWMKADGSYTTGTSLRMIDLPDNATQNQINASPKFSNSGRVKTFTITNPNGDGIDYYLWSGQNLVGNAHLMVASAQGFLSNDTVSHKETSNVTAFSTAKTNGGTQLAFAVEVGDTTILKAGTLYFGSFSKEVSSYSTMAGSHTYPSAIMDVEASMISGNNTTSVLVVTKHVDGKVRAMIASVSGFSVTFHPATMLTINDDVASSVQVIYAAGAGVNSFRWKIGYVDTSANATWHYIGWNNNTSSPVALIQTDTAHTQFDPSKLHLCEFLEFRLGTNFENNVMCFMSPIGATGVQVMAWQWEEATSGSPAITYIYSQVINLGADMYSISHLDRFGDTAIYIVGSNGVSAVPFKVTLGGVNLGTAEAFPGIGDFESLHRVVAGSTNAAVTLISGQDTTDKFRVYKNMWSSESYVDPSTEPNSIVVGISTENGNPAKVATQSRVFVTSGLTPGREYYVDTTDNTITDTETNFPIGMALSTTQLLVDIPSAPATAQPATGTLAKYLTTIDVEDQLTAYDALQASIFADGMPGLRVAGRPAIRFANTGTGINKINWYLFAPTGLTLAEITSIFVKLDNRGAKKPWITVYTKPTGTGDLGAWYKDKVTFGIGSDAIAGMCTLTTSEDVATGTDVDHILLTRNSSGGDLVTATVDTNEILYIVLSTNSAATIGQYDFDLYGMSYTTATDWFEVDFDEGERETITWKTEAAALPKRPLAGDRVFVTSDGTKTGGVIKEYVADNAGAWVMIDNTYAAEFGKYTPSTTTQVSGGLITLTKTDGNLSSIGTDVLLKAGVTYELFADLCIPSESTSYHWQTAAGLRISNYGAGTSPTASSNTNSSSAHALYTPAVDTYVRLQTDFVSLGSVATNAVSVARMQAYSTVYIKAVAGQLPSTPYGYAAEYNEFGLASTTIPVVGSAFQLLPGAGTMPVLSGQYIALKAGVTYELDAFLGLRTSTWATYSWRTQGGLDLGTEGLSGSMTSSDPAATTRAKSIYTPTVDTNVMLVSRGGTGTTTIHNVAHASITVKAIAKQLAITPDYGQAALYGKYLPKLNTIATNAIPTLTLQAGNIPSAGQTITLKAGITYELFADLNIAGSWGYYRWCKTDGTLIGTEGIGFSSMASNINPGTTPAHGIYTPSVDTAVQLKLMDVSLGGITNANAVPILPAYSTVFVKAIGNTLPVTKSLATCTDVTVKPHAIQTTIARGAALRCFDGINWESDTIEGYANNDVPFVTPWGLELKWQSSLQQSLYRYTKYPNWYGYTLPSYWTGDNPAASRSTGVDGENNVSAANWAYMWGGDLNLGYEGGMEKGIYMFAASPTAYSLGNYEEFEITCVLGSGYNNNFFRVRRLR